jgi:hypothetical protein
VRLPGSRDEGSRPAHTCYDYGVGGYNTSYYSGSTYSPSSYYSGSTYSPAYSYNDYSSGYSPTYSYDSAGNQRPIVYNSITTLKTSTGNGLAKSYNGLLFGDPDNPIVDIQPDYWKSAEWPEGSETISRSGYLTLWGLMDVFGSPSPKKRIPIKLAK